ncbi:MAG: histidine phosphatase family protein, partial [archaeon]|nr:histidine phosphatase family protein [archaeon]
ASPFKRCRATAETILSVLNDPAENLHFVDGFFQSTLLVEQNFGLFEGLSKAEIEEIYPKEYAFFTKCISHGGRFYARMPLGESRADVTQRVHQFLRIELGLGIVTPSFPTIPTVHIIVSHGVTVRCMAMLLTGETPEWCEIEPNPRNCTVRLITDGADHKYLS